MKVQLLFFNYIQRCYKLFVSVLLCITICLGVFSQNKQIDMAYDNFNKLYVRGKYIDAKNIGDTIKLKIRNKQTVLDGLLNGLSCKPSCISLCHICGIMNMV